MFSQNLIFFIFSHLKDSCAASEAAHATNCNANSISMLVARFERVSMRAAQQLSFQALQTRIFRKIQFSRFFGHLKNSCAAAEAAHATNCNANSISMLVARFERVSMRAAQQLSFQALQTRIFRKIQFSRFVGYLKHSCAAAEAAHATNCNANS